MTTSSEILTTKVLGPNQYEIHIELPDTLGLLSIITGLFACSGINILKGKVKTQGKVAIDVFEVKTPSSVNWKKIESDLSRLADEMRKRQQSDVRAELNDRIIQYLRGHENREGEILPPIELAINQNVSSTETLVEIKSQDTPAFLYELTNALSLLGINVVKMEVSTVADQVFDQLWVTTADGEKVVADRQLKSLQWAVLLMKKFTHMLSKVPDPKAALDQMTMFGKDVLERDDFSEVLLALKDKKAMERLSQLLGTSRYLWEEFIRTQHDAIFPILADEAMLKVKKNRAQMIQELQVAVQEKASYEEKEEALNEYKDREIFRIDLRHILGRVSYLGEFAVEFTELCEAVCEVTSEIVKEELLKTHSYPKISENKFSDLSICALGKFGGCELGYASDLELLFIYTDVPNDASEKSQENLKFYSEFVRRFKKIIHARSEGVFEMDLRLRPYGKDGPLAASLDLFKDYYKKEGDAWDFERMALIKLRPITGPEELRKEILDHRDAYTFGTEVFDFAEAKKLRKKKHSELITKSTTNAKYSPGGLLDIEYLIQTMQVLYGRSLGGETRNPTSLKALRALWQSGVVEEKKFQTIRACYLFLRSVINALRIVRGHAKDLAIPKTESKEFVSLARRMGYRGEDQKVRTAFQTACRRYMEMANNLYQEGIKELEARQNKGDLKPQFERQDPRTLRVSLDDLLRGEVTPSMKQVLEALGFCHLEDSMKRFQRICPSSLAFEPFALMMDHAWSLWSRVPDPDLALQHLEYFLETLSDVESFWKELTESPRKMERLLFLLGSSKYLSNALIAHPQIWSWAQSEKDVSLKKTRDRIKHFAKDTTTNLEIIQRFRHEETLRIALVLFSGSSSLNEVYRVFSDLADAVISRLLTMTELESKVCVVGLGKLGGQELNFSSDIDLLFMTPDTITPAEIVPSLEQFLNLLKQGSLYEFLFRVDLRLRPHGKDGSLAMTVSDTVAYYQNIADPWEHQVLLKARPITGPIKIWKEVEKVIQQKTYRAKWDTESLGHLRSIKRRYEDKAKSEGEWDCHIKLGWGGIRDAEFSVQILQLMHGRENPKLQNQNTLKALEEIKKMELLSQEDCQTLKEAYLFLRVVENRLQLYDNRQVFLVPTDAQELRIFAKGLRFHDNQEHATEVQFQIALKEIRKRCRTLFEKIFY